MAATAYFAPTTNLEGERIHPEYDPSPVPLLKYAYTGASQQTLCSRDESGNITPPRTYHFLGGGHISGAKLQVKLPGLTRAQYEGICALLLRCSSFLFSYRTALDTVKVYQCAIDGNVGDPEEIDGTLLVSWSMTLKVIADVTPAP